MNIKTVNQHHENFENDVFMFYVLLTSFVTIITFLAGCVCCRKKVPKNELLGLEGLMKIKNPDDNNQMNSNSSVVVSIDPNALSAGNDFSNSDLRSRSSNAPHRSLPDIPISDQVGDTNSELYATVGDKVLEMPQGRSPKSVLKQASVSQHSSLSQADDISSPYARVKASHDYDKVKDQEHPYAHINQTGPSGVIHLISEEPSSQQLQQQNSPTGIDATDCGVGDGIIPCDNQEHEIPAASAIAGRIAASQELPYMTPPIVQPPQQNFSGDSQDSSKGYTSISVREPLANIIAQTNQRNNVKMTRRDESDYATVSDDSDEMYAAIDDPNNPGDLYTSGSETYAQIQPPGTQMTVAVEINAVPRLSQEIVVATVPSSTGPSKRLSGPSNVGVVVTPQIVAAATTQIAMHSRQASSSSCTSSVGNLGSPKPEKRQANSPLPPPPKNSTQAALLAAQQQSSTAAVSVRNSIASVVEMPVSSGTTTTPSITKEVGQNETKTISKKGSGGETDPKAKRSPSKDLEGMYAKVMKKNKLSNAPSQNSSPVLQRKNDGGVNAELFLSDPDISKDINVGDFSRSSVHSSPVKRSSKASGTSVTADVIVTKVDSTDNNYETIDKRRGRSNSFDNKDPGYETIPGDKGNNGSDIMNKSFNDFTHMGSAGAAHSKNNDIQQSEPGYESLNSTIDSDKSSSNADPGYEILADLTTRKPSDGSSKTASSQRISLDYDPNYEVLRPPPTSQAPTSNKNTTDDQISDDGYAKVLEKNNKLNRNHQMMIDHGYSSIKKGDNKLKISNHHDYASIKETNVNSLTTMTNNNNDGEIECGDSSGIYTSIVNDPTELSPASTQPANGSLLNSPSYSTVSDASRTTASLGSSRSSDMQIMGYHLIGGRDSSSKLFPGGSGSSLTSPKTHSSNYESLTESESDPNYEHVKYPNVIDENPYERLVNEKSPEPPPSKSVSSPLLSTFTMSSTTKTGDLANDSLTNLGTLVDKSSMTTTKSSGSLEVGDYFQV